MQNLYGVPEIDPITIDTDTKIYNRSGRFGLILFALLLLPVIFLFVIQDKYLDISPLCAIKLQGDSLKGNSRTIEVALKKIKNTNLLDYELVCSYVSAINESQCLYSTDDGFKVHAADTDGCFLKGSKTVYLSPASDDSADAVTRRAEAIVKYAKLSRAYWTDN